MNFREYLECRSIVEAYLQQKGMDGDVDAIIRESLMEGSRWPLRWALAGLLGLSGLAGHARGEDSIFDDDWADKHPAQVQVVPPTPHTQNPTQQSTGTKPIQPLTRPSLQPQPAPITQPSNRERVVNPVPDAGALQRANLKISDAYGADLRTANKREMAQRLYAAAMDTKSDQTMRYALLKKSMELAMAGGDPATASKCLREMGNGYDIDYPTMKLAMMKDLSTTITKPGELRDFVTGMTKWADNYAKHDRYDVAQRAMATAGVAARRSGDSSLEKQTDEHTKKIEKTAAGFSLAKAKMVVLESNPDDPGANYVVGRFYALLKGNWDKGLPYLAKGSDPKVKDLATKELAGGSDLEVADGWWAQGEKEHAVELYKKVLPSLEGIEKARVEKRLVSAPPDEFSGMTGEWRIDAKRSYVLTWTGSEFALEQHLNGTVSTFKQSSISPGVVLFRRNEVKVSPAKNGIKVEFPGYTFYGTR